MKYLLIAMAFLATACSDSETERALRKQQQQLAVQQQQLQLQQQQQLAQAQPYQQQYAPQVVQQPAPVVIQQPASSGSSHVTDMLLGGLVGHAVGNAMSNRNSSPSYDRYDSRPSNVTHVTKNITINKAPVSRPSAVRMPSSVRRK
jgi:uncharacterized protein YycO